MSWVCDRCEKLDKTHGVIETKITILKRCGEMQKDIEDKTELCSTCMADLFVWFERGKPNDQTT